MLIATALNSRETTTKSSKWNHTQTQIQVAPTLGACKPLHQFRGPVIEGFVEDKL